MERALFRLAGKRATGGGVPRTDAVLFRSGNVLTKNAVDLSLVATPLGAFLEPGEEVGVQPDGDSLLQRTIELPAARINPVFGQSLGDIGGVDILVSKLRQSRKLIALGSTKGPLLYSTAV